MLAVISFSGCYKLQKDYKYNAFTLDPNIGMSAKDFLISRGKAPVVTNDTVFKWMQLGLEYAGFDLTEFDKPGRTFIFLHNNAIRTISTVKINGVDTKVVSGGFFYDYGFPVYDAAGVLLKSKLNSAVDSVRPAINWNEYPQQFVKDYFMYLILQGEYSFENLSITNTAIQTLLAPGTTAPKESRLGWVVTKSAPNPDPTLAANIYIDKTLGKGFDPEGKINLKLINNQNAPINVNDRLDDRTAGYFASNGKVHVYDKTVHPFRYSYP